MQLKEVIHYYIGQKVKYNSLVMSIGGNSGGCWINHKNLHELEAAGIAYKPILRRFEDLTEEEKKKYVSLSERVRFSNKLTIEYDTPKSFHYLLSIGIDLFGLIDSGQAIDKKTM